MSRAPAQLSVGPSLYSDASSFISTRSGWKLSQALTKIDRETRAGDSKATCR